MTMPIPETTDENVAPPVPEAFKRFAWDIQSMVELTESEREILFIGSDLMTRLTAGDDWLPEVFATPDPARRQQFQLYADGLERFSIAATVLAPGQVLPAVLDPVWEIVGVLRGAVELTRFHTSDGQFEPKGEATVMRPGQVVTFRSGGRDALRLGNALDDGISIVLHVYGGEMARIDRRTFTPDGEALAEPIVCANPAGAPPYDIFSIQTRIED